LEKKELSHCFKNFSLLSWEKGRGFCLLIDTPPVRLMIERLWGVSAPARHAAPWEKERLKG